VPGAGGLVFSQQLSERHLDRDPELAVGIVVGPRRVDVAAEQRGLDPRARFSAAPGARPSPDGRRDRDGGDRVGEAAPSRDCALRLRHESVTTVAFGLAECPSEVLNADS